MVNEEEKFVSRFADGEYSQINRGGHGCLIYRLRYHGLDSVLKAGKVGSRSDLEVLTNIDGYREMREKGIDDLISPKIYFQDEYGGYVALVTEYVGEDLIHSANESTISFSMKVLEDVLRKVYEKTIKHSPSESKEWVKRIKGRIDRCFCKHFNNKGLVTPFEIDKVCAMSIPSTDYVAWATADLKLDNICISEQRGVRIIDPKCNSSGDTHY